MLLSIQFVAMPNRNDALLLNSQNDLVIESSGSLGLYRQDSKCEPTFPNMTVFEDKKKDWCSNIPKETGGKPWIQYSFTNKAMKIKAYSVRSGCCYHYECCCDLESGEKADYYCCCRLYSFSLLGSNDNITWKMIHNIEKETSFYYCKLYDFEFQQPQSFKYIRFVLDQSWPGCPNCMQLNQLELFGEKVDLFDDYEKLENDNDESISIIGKIKKI